MGFDFSLVDVFTDRPFGGNRLAVFPDATGIADATMQQLACEFNFSEWIGRLCAGCLGTIAVGARLRRALTSDQD